MKAKIPTIIKRTKKFRKRNIRVLKKTHAVNEAFTLYMTHHRTVGVELVRVGREGGKKGWEGKEG